MSWGFARWLARPPAMVAVRVCGVGGGAGVFILVVVVVGAMVEEEGWERL